MNFSLNFREGWLPNGTQINHTGEFSEPFYTYGELSDGADAWSDAGLENNTHSTDGENRQITHLLNDGFYGEGFETVRQGVDAATASSTESTTADLSASESGFATEQQSINADIGAGDVGAIDYVNASEHSELIEIFDTDIIGVNEEESAYFEVAHFFESESATFSDSEALNVSLDEVDSGAGLETDFYRQTPDHFDGVAYVEDELAAAAIADTDSASFSETHLLDISDNESASFVDEAELAASLQGQDSNGTTTEISLVEASFTEQETLSATEAEDIVVDAASSEPVLIVDTASVEAAVQDADEISAVETEILGKSSADSFSSTEDELIYVDIFDTDNISYAESELIPVQGDTSADTDPYHVQVLATNPDHFWRFSELNGTLVQDKQARADGIIYGTTQFSRGLVAGENTSLSFDGSTSVRFGDLFIDYDKFTLEFTVKDITGPIFMKSGEVEVISDGTKLIFRVFSSEDELAYYGEHAETTGHFVWAIGGGLATLYYNGAEVWQDVKSASDYNTFNSLIIGNGATGIIDDVAVYSKQLTHLDAFRHYYAAVLNESYTNSIQAIRPAMHLTFNDTVDEYDGFFEPVVSGAPAYVDGPKKFFVYGDRAVDMQGAEFTYDTGALVNGMSEFTIGMSLAVNAGTTLPQFIVGESADWSVIINATGNIEFNPSFASVGFSSVGTINDEQWHHIILSGSNGTLKIYIDGELDSTQTLDSDIVSSSDIKFGGPGSDFRAFEFFIAEYAIDQSYVTALYNTVHHGRNDLSVSNDSSFEALDDGFTAYNYNVALAVT